MPEIIISNVLIGT